MGAELYAAEPAFRAAVDACCDVLTPELGIELRDLIFRPRAGAPDSEALLSETWVTQPAIFVLEYALAQLWRSWGVEPAAMVGHSVGEYVAACLSGVFAVEDALRLVAARGR